MSHSFVTLLSKLNQFTSRQVDRHTLHIAGLFTFFFNDSADVELAKRDFFVKEYSAYMLDNQNKISGIYINVNTTYTF